MYNPYMYDQQNQYRPVGDVIIYVVNKGDNLYRIAQKLNSEVQWIQAMNNIGNDYKIYPDQELMIPRLFKMRPEMQQRNAYEMYF